jgi:hypothetical protein
MNSYAIFIKTSNGVSFQTHYEYNSSYDLVELYKDAIINKKELIVFDYGVLRTDDIAGIFITNRRK